MNANPSIDDIVKTVNCRDILLPHYKYNLLPWEEIEAKSPVVMVKDWQIVGPFDNTNNVFNYEYKEVLDNAAGTKTFDGEGGRKIKWELLPTKHMDYWIEYGECYGQIGNDEIHYLQSFVQSNQEQEVLLHLTTQQKYRVWINDKTMDEAQGEESYKVYKCKLNKGYNRIVVQLTSGSSNNFSLYFTTIGNKGIKDFGYSATPQAYTKSTTNVTTDVTPSISTMWKAYNKQDTTSFLYHLGNVQHSLYEKEEKQQTILNNAYKAFPSYVGFVNYKIDLLKESGGTRTISEAFGSKITMTIRRGGGETDKADSIRMLKNGLLNNSKEAYIYYMKGLEELENNSKEDKKVMDTLATCIKNGIDTYGKTLELLTMQYNLSTDPKEEEALLKNIKDKYSSWNIDKNYYLKQIKNGKKGKEDYVQYINQKYGSKPNTPFVAFEADQYFDKNEFSKALKSLDVLEKSHFFANVGNKLAEKKEYNTAIQLLKKEKERYPFQSNVRENLASAYDYTNQTELAKTEYKNLITLTNSNDEEWYKKAGIVTPMSIVDTILLQKVMDTLTNKDYKGKEGESIAALFSYTITGLLNTSMTEMSYLIIKITLPDKKC